MARHLALGAMIGMGMAPVAVLAQQDPSSHEQHHPGAAPSAPPAATANEPPATDRGVSPTLVPPELTAPAAPASDPVVAPMMRMMQQMMRNMSPAPKELYPTLMSLPRLDDAQRAEVLRAAQERMQRGFSMMADAQGRLTSGRTANDARMMNETSALLREGLAIFDSGVAAQRAIAEGRPPQALALAWFRRELNLADRTDAQPAHAGSGFSPFHIVTMAALAAFSLLAWIIYVRRSRRVAALLQQLAAESGGRTKSSAPRANSGPASDVPPPAPPPLPQLSPTLPPKALPDATEAVVGKSPDGRTPAPGKVPAWRGMLRVAAVFDETPSIKTFRLIDPRGGAIPFAFLPGQFLWIHAGIDGATRKRSYTIASSPTQRDYVEITVKREEHGAVSRHLHERVAAGDSIEIEAPFGYFTFDGSSADAIVLIGGGVGATPLMSVVRYLTDRCWTGDIFFLYCCRTSADFVFRDELERLQRRHPTLHIMASMTRAAGTVWIGPTGRITKELIEQSVPDIARRRVHLCGPPPMMDELRSILAELGVPRAQLKTEAFGTEKRAAAARSATPTAAAPPAKEAKAPTVRPTMVPTVTFSRSGKSAPLAPDMSVLEAAESVGVEIENSCRSGTCGTCKVRLLGGSVTMAVEDALEAGEKAEGWILACQAKSSGDLVVEA